jgi:predicted glycosyl hydrolase (DUF1957 family)
VRVGHVAVVLWAHAPAGPDAGGPASPFRRARLALVAEALLPLVGTLDRLQRDGLSLPITMALSPALWAGLEHPLVQAELDADLEQAVRLAAEEVERTRSSPASRPSRGCGKSAATAGRWPRWPSTPAPGVSSWPSARPPMRCCPC